MLPQSLYALVAIVWSIKDRTRFVHVFNLSLITKHRSGCGDALYGLFLALLYPLVVPAISIYCAARELFWGEDYEKDLTDMKGLKMFEILG